MSDWRLLSELERFERRLRAIDRLAEREPVRTRGLSLMEFIPRLTPTFAQPRHLAPLIDVLERAPKEKLRVVVSCCPRIGKTESVLHSIPYALAEDPSVPFMYGAASAALVTSKSARARDLAVEAGVRLSTSSKSKTEWLTVGADGRPAGGGLRAFSIEGSPIGHGARVLLLDDLISGHAQAASQIERDRIWEALRSGWFTRLAPNGSIVLVMQRFHPEDPAGRALAEGWDEVRITPYLDDGSTLWPERFSPEYWRELEIEVGPLNWQSQYLQNPLPPEGRMFGDAVLCDESDVPAGARCVVGADLAYTASDRSDEQAAIVMKRSGDHYYIVDGTSRRANLTTEIRGARREPGFTQDLRTLQARHGATEIVQYTGGREDATISLLAKLDPEERVKITGMRAATDKVTRIQPFLGAYRAGRVSIVRGKFADRLVAHLAEFTGARGGKDDLADACAAAFDRLARGGSGGGPRASGTGEGSYASRISRFIAVAIPLALALVTQGVA